MKKIEKNITGFLLGLSNLDIFYGVLCILLGGMFIFSGMVKLNDPIGLALKLEEYFGVFASDGLTFFLWFKPLSIPLALLLITLEILLGIALVVCYRMRISLYLAIGLLFFFSLLTLYSAYFERVTDCGCFGDAIKLTPWGSFFKDVALLVGIIFLYVLQRKRLTNKAEDLLRPPRRGADWAMLGLMLFSFFIGIYTLFYLPYVDFRPYRIGAHIPTLLQPVEVPRYGYVFEKDGNRVTVEKYNPREGYRFIEAVLLNPETATPEVKDYVLWNESGDATAHSLTGDKLLIIIHKNEKLSRSQARKLSQKISLLPTRLSPWLVSSLPKDVHEELFAQVPHLNALPHYQADANLLLTMVRSSPGLIFLSDGYVQGKWAFANWPSNRELLDLQSQERR